VDLSQYYFVPLSGVEVGQVFQGRKELSHAGVHGPWMAGIDGNKVSGARSIVMSGGYDDDVDQGDRIIYTGSGKVVNGMLVADQVLDRGNEALAKSCDEKLPIRVSRGEHCPSPYAPLEGYRYDGYYAVVRYFQTATSSGFNAWQFELLRLPGQPPLPPPVAKEGRSRKQSKKRFTSENLYQKKRDSSEPRGIRQRKRMRNSDDSGGEESERERPVRRTITIGKIPFLASTFDAPYHDRPLLANWMMLRGGMCFVCGKKLDKGDLERTQQHLVMHKEHTEADMTEETLNILQVRSVLNQLRIRNVIESTWDEDALVTIPPAVDPAE